MIGKGAGLRKQKLSQANMRVTRYSSEICCANNPTHNASRRGVKLHGAVMTIDPATHLSTAIERVSLALPS